MTSFQGVLARAIARCLLYYSRSRPYYRAGDPLMKRLFTLIAATSLFVIGTSALLIAQEKPAHAAKASGKSASKTETSDAQKASAAADKSTASKDPLENMKFRNLGP